MHATTHPPSGIEVDKYRGQRNMLCITKDFTVGIMRLLLRRDVHPMPEAAI